MGDHDTRREEHYLLSVNSVSPVQFFSLEVGTGGLGHPSHEAR